MYWYANTLNIVLSLSIVSFNANAVCKVRMAQATQKCHENTIVRNVSRTLRRLRRYTRNAIEKHRAQNTVVAKIILSNAARQATRDKRM